MDNLINKILIKINRWKKSKIFNDEKYCPICGQKSVFSPMGTIKPLRKNAQCSKCGSLERHRFLYFIYNFYFLKTSQKLNILHIAPEKAIYDLISKNANINYTQLDLYPHLYPHAKNCVEANACSMPFQDKTFDVIIHNQVMEHIEDEKKFIYECIRVLKNDGFMLINIPMNETLEKTYCDLSIKTERAREKAYGQKDHIRLYGNDVLSDYPDLHIEKISENIMTQELIDLMQLKRDVPSGLEFPFSDGYFIVKKSEVLYDR